MMIGLIVIPVLKAGPPTGSPLKFREWRKATVSPTAMILYFPMTENELYSYEWLVDKDGNGFIPINNAGTESISPVRLTVL